MVAWCLTDEAGEGGRGMEDVEMEGLEMGEGKIYALRGFVRCLSHTWSVDLELT